MYNEIELQSIDTNALVLLLTCVAMEKEESDDNIFSVFLKLVTSSPTWFDLFYLINQISISIDICKTLPVFYCFTGCYTNSSFNGKVKCSFF